MRICDNGIYRDATPAEIAEYERATRLTPEQEIADCKAQLQATDYKAIKHAEGELSAEEYEPIRLERRNLRKKINELEQELGA